MSAALRAIAALALFSLACSCDSPTRAVPFSVAGKWTGVMPIRTPSGTWTEPASVTLTQTGDAVTGAITSSDGVSYQLSGTGSRDGLMITLAGLPGNSTCAGVMLSADRFWYSGGTVTRMSGRASGRCFGTIAGDFTLARAD